jgi:hypothetical protein
MREREVRARAQRERGGTHPAKKLVISILHIFAYRSDLREAHKRGIKHNGQRR